MPYQNLSVQHTPDCTFKVEMFLRRCREWEERWPGHCHVCKGQGGTPFDGNYENPSGGEPCPYCVEDYKCGRCGALAPVVELEKGDVLQCAVCGWTDDPDAQGEDFVHPNADGMGPFGGGPCDCEIADMQDDERRGRA